MSISKRLEHLEAHTTKAGIWQCYSRAHGTDITQWDDRVLDDCIAELQRLDPPGFNARQAEFAAMTDEALEALVQARGLA